MSIEGRNGDEIGREEIQGAGGGRCGVEAAEATEGLDRGVGRPGA